MRKGILKKLYLIVLVLFTSFASAAGAENNLLGDWSCRHEGLTHSLKFISAGQLKFDNELLNYMEMSGILLIQEEGEIVNYSYTLQGDKLTIGNPDYSITECSRSQGKSNNLRSKKKESPVTSHASPSGKVSTGDNVPPAQGEIGGEGWGFKLKPVMGWKQISAKDGLIMLGHDTIPGMILIYPHHEVDIPSIRNKMLEGIEEEDIRLTVSGDIQARDNNTLAADYAGTVGSERAKARGIGNLSPYGGGTYILAVTTAEKYSKKHVSAAEAIAKNMKFLKTDVAQLVRKFAHRWTHLSSQGYSQTDIYFYSDGRYADNYEASYGGQFKDQYGSQSGNWGAYNSDKGRGRWTVRGEFRRGQIFITKNDGTETVLNYEVHVKNGVTYWGEYFFNGVMYFINDKGIYGTD
jgi:hypothetical protein